MTRQEHLLTIAGEECAEIIQRLSKAKRFGMKQVQEDIDDKPEENPLKLTNEDRIRQEYTDLVAVMEMLDLKEFAPSEKDKKKAKVERYLRRSKKEGTLQEV